MEEFENKKNLLSLKDISLISLIAVSLAFFIMPILKNLDLSFFIDSNWVFILFTGFLIILANLALWISSVISQKIPVFLQIAKFAAVGGFNTFLNWGVVNLLMLITQIFKGPLYALFIAIAFFIANIGSFFWNKYWIFPTNRIKEQDSAKKDFIQFFLVSIIGMGIQTGIAFVWVEWINSSFSQEIWANISLFIGTLFSMIWNFLGYKFIVFKK